MLFRSVRLGEHSGGLCAIDFDDDRSLEEFLAVNPVLRGSARWKGRRGAQIGVRVAGKYPGPCSARHPQETVEVNGRQLGRPLYEWRSTGNLSTVKGVHPSGCEYQVLVDKPPVVLEFSQIRWPEGWPVPGARNEIEELLKRCGVPWSFGKGGSGVLHPTFFAGYMATKERYLFDAVTQQHYWYTEERGIWISMSREEMQQRALETSRRVLLDQVASTQDPRLPSLLTRLTVSFADQVVDLIGALQVERNPFGRPDSVVHCSNVMVDLRSVPYAMHGFGPAHVVHDLLDRLALARRELERQDLRGRCPHAVVHHGHERLGLHRRGPTPPRVADLEQEELLEDEAPDRKSTRLNSSHVSESRMPSSA